MEEGTVASWLKQVGDTVEEGDILACPEHLCAGCHQAKWCQRKRSFGGFLSDSRSVKQNTSFRP